MSRKGDWARETLSPKHAVASRCCRGLPSKTPNHLNPILDGLIKELRLIQVKAASDREKKMAALKELQARLALLVCEQEQSAHANHSKHQESFWMMKSCKSWHGLLWHALALCVSSLLRVGSSSCFRGENFGDSSVYLGWPLRRSALRWNASPWWLLQPIPCMRGSWLLENFTLRPGHERESNVVCTKGDVLVGLIGAGSSAVWAFFFELYRCLKSCGYGDMESEAKVNCAGVSCSSSLSHAYALLWRPRPRSQGRNRQRRLPGSAMRHRYLSMRSWK